MRRFFVCLIVGVLAALAGMPLFGRVARPARPVVVKLGIDVLAEQNFAPLIGKRVGLLTHPAGVNRHGVSTVDILLRAPNVRLMALFGPEHGIYGDEKADVKIPNRRDERTGLPVFSLYGDTRKPTKEMLSRIDVLVVDLQDIGSRSYTFVSCMLYAMEAAFEAGKTVVILDRPNPLGGLKVDGPPLEEQWRSYVGAFRAPYVHGLTIGEIARIAKDNPGWLRISESARKNGKLIVVPMHGWRRSMLWQHTNLHWVPTSPAIPTPQAALGYAMTGLGCQLGGFQHGYGTPYPFRLLTFPTKSPQEIVSALKARKIPGVDFQVRSYKNRLGQTKSGAYVSITSWEQLQPVLLSYHLHDLAARWTRTNPYRSAKPSDAGLFNKHFGDTAWWNELTSKGAQGGFNIEAFRARWQKQAQQFQQWSRPWWLYQ